MFRQILGRVTQRDCQYAKPDIALSSFAYQTNFLSIDEFIRIPRFSQCHSHGFEEFTVS